ncbi:MAG: PIN domain-containing protein [Armatimonadetes bacterium]|nr:PIN domain-containing protein [Armatimonadota bacterium]
MDRLPAPDLLDTGLLLHLVRRDALAQWALEGYGFLREVAQPLVSIVSIGEIQALALRLGWGHQRRRRLEELLERAIAVPLDFPGVIEAYARIDAHCRRLGTPIGENDTWIAATAHATGARLLTTDRDFEHLDPTFLRHEWIDPTQHR